MRPHTAPTANTCGSACASCLCIRPEGHDGPHVCECGGAQLDGGARIWALPGDRTGLTEDTVEAYAADLPADPLSVDEAVARAMEIWRAQE